MNRGEIIIYQTPDGITNLDVRLENETIWLTQAQMVMLFDSSKANISEHIKHIYKSNELEDVTTVRKFRTVQTEVKREVSRELKTLEESIATAMDGSYVAIVPFLPYILQDFWEIGTQPEIVINFVKKHCIAKTKNISPLNVLDLGCGKGAVSVRLAAALKCKCYGIDAIPDFIDTAKEKARKYGVNTLCQFEVADIRTKIAELDKFYVIILGAVGQVFGNFHTTLTILSDHLATEGIIIIDDAYIDDSSTFQQSSILKRSELLKQIRQAQMELIDEKTGEIPDSNLEFENLQKRCKELITKHPEKASIFEDYIQNQAKEYDMMENRVICSTMVFKKNVYW